MFNKVVLFNCEKLLLFYLQITKTLQFSRRTAFLLPKGLLMIYFFYAAASAKRNTERKKVINKYQQNP